MAKERKKIGCLGIVGVILAVGFLGSLFSNNSDEIAESYSPSPSRTESPQPSETPTEKPKPAAPETFLEAGQLDAESLTIAASELCSPIEGVLLSSELGEKTKSRADTLAGITDAYDADDYVQDNSWVRPLVTVELLGDVSAITTQAFDALLENSAFEGASELENNYPGTYGKLASEFEEAVLEECELAENYASQRDLARQATRVVNLANNVPWYPKGFTEYEDGLTAWDWADRSCSYYSGRCSHMDVVTWIGCPNLYVEVNFLDSSNSVIDWSNDTARGLRAGDRAKLEFVSFDDNARSTRLVEISCY